MNRKEQIRDLWRICFHDTEEFINLYFDRVYRDEQALTIEHKGKVVSALQIIPYRMTWCGSLIKVGYISGACTHPDYRNKKLMKDLLEESFRVMRMREFDITALIPAEPWLFDYYRNHGYTEAFDYSLSCYTCPSVKANPHSLEIVVPDLDKEKEWYPFFDKKLKERPACLLHTEEDLLTIIADNRMSNGIILGVRNKKDKPLGLAFIVSDEKEAILKEMVYTDDTVKEFLLQEISTSIGTGRVMVKHPASLNDPHRQGMAMILNREKMIWQWLSVHPDMPFTAEEMNRMENETLTRNLLNYAQREAYMSLMFD